MSHEAFSIDLFSQRLKVLRQAKNERQEDLAAAVGLETSTVTRLELGQRKPSIEVICLIAGHFNVSLDYLTGRVDNPKGGLPDDE